MHLIENIMIHKSQTYFTRNIIGHRTKANRVNDFNMSKIAAILNVANILANLHVVDGTNYFYSL